MNETPVQGLLARVGLGIGLAALALLVLVMGIWGALLLALAGPGNEIVRAALVVALCLASVAILIAVFIRRWRWRAMGAFAVLCAAVIAFWTSIEPTNERDWQPDVAVLPYATFAGDLVTVHNIRNFDYRSESDYTVAYYDKTFDLRELRSVDIVTDERDVIRLRTNYRRDPPEDVYVYRVRGSLEAARRLFMQYMEQMDALRTQPEFYNTLTTNCTTNIWMNARVNPGHPPLSWKILASGYVPEYMYEQGRLEDMGLSFDELQRRAHVNARAKAADTAPDFSRRIRAWSE